MDLPNFNDIKVEISDQSVDDTNNTRKCVTLLSENCLGKQRAAAGAPLFNYCVHASLCN